MPTSPTNLARIMVAQATACARACEKARGPCRCVQTARAIMALENEACAQVAEGFAKQGDWDTETAECVAASIRERPELAATV